MHPPDPSRRPTLLVAEDNPLGLDLIREQLLLLGWRAELVTDGQAALDRWRAARHPLVLTDVQMPRLDGLQLTEAIRAEEARDGLRRTPIVALTASAMPHEAAQCRQAGMDDHLAKPVSIHDLKAALQRWLEPAGPHPAADPAGAPETTTPGRPALDLGRLRDLIGDDPSLVAQFLADFRIQLQDTAQALVAAHQAQRPDEVRRLAHHLKSAAQGVGAMPLGDLCGQLEAAARRNEPDTLGAVVQQFLDETARVRRSL